MRTTFKRSLLTLVISAAVTSTACSNQTTTQKTPNGSDARQFIKTAETQLNQVINNSSKADWVYSNFITDDTAQLSSEANAKMTATIVSLANEAAKYDTLDLDADARRKLNKLKLALVLPAPKAADKTAELAGLSSKLSGMYGAGKYCKGDACRTLGDLSEVLATSRDYDELLDAWSGWRTVAPQMKQPFERLVALSNEGSKELGFTDTGSYWRSKYDMPANDFSTELDRLWGQVKPLYNSLHCHVRAKLSEKYGEDKVPVTGAIPAHLLGNMWAQSWGNIYDLAAPENADPGYDVTRLLEEKQYTELQMVEGAERFFTSLGFSQLPETFWTRSLFTKPKDRDVVCHASAWDVDGQDDIRIKMCIKKTGEDFSTIHHELGHNFYQRAYKHQSVIYQDSANDGFHEAIGDTIALSITPEYLQKIGLLDQVPDTTKDIGLLMKMAMEKIAFIPFGLLVDQWRWKVFNGEITPAEYNKVWWELREKYQGVAAPIARPDDAFDPGSKYHVPANTPYTRYFLAHILQFQFHRELCKIAGNEGPIHRCSIYESEAAGKVLNDVLEMGSSKPWQDALQKLAGNRDMDATAILDYFAPLQIWLDKQNANRNCGW